MQAGEGTDVDHGTKSTVESKDYLLGSHRAARRHKCDAPSVWRRVYRLSARRESSLLRAYSPPAAASRLSVARGNNTRWYRKPIPSSTTPSPITDSAR